MKKKVFMIALATTLGLSGYFFTNNRDESEELNGLQIENVEALARNEVESIKCNPEITGVCIIINGKPTKGERY
jgi:uncharacterized protein YlzI (FlbEa/FlbD family)